jgi:amidohydrolase
MEGWIDALRRRALDLDDDLRALRHHLHQHPEVSHEEVETAKLVVERLRALGLNPRAGVGGHGVTADLRLGDGPRVVAMRADMDALPIQDQKTCAHRSRRANVMHACGHDLHTTVLLGVAQLLTGSGLVAPGTVRLVFQPAEEATPGGANGMAAAGVMDGVSAILALHSDPSLPPGRIGVRRGPATASTDQFRIEVIGRSGHSSRPHQAVDAIFVGSSILTAIYQLGGTRIDPRRAAVVNVGRIRGGEAPNALGDRCVLEGCIRCTDEETRATLAAALGSLCRHLAEAAGARVEISIANGAPPLFNDLRLATVVHEAAVSVLGSDAVEDLPEPSMGGEDFSVYGKHAPAMLVRLGTAPPGEYVPLHSNVFDVDDRAIAPAVTLMATTLVTLLRE